MPLCDNLSFVCLCLQVVLPQATTTNPNSNNLEKNGGKYFKNNCRELSHKERNNNNSSANNQCPQRERIVSKYSFSLFSFSSSSLDVFSARLYSSQNVNSSGSGPTKEGEGGDVDDTHDDFKPVIKLSGETLSVHQQIEQVSRLVL